MAQRSLYELMHGSLTVVAKQHFVYHFSGKGHENGKNWWFTGDGTDVWDSEGVAITPSSSRSELHHGDKRQYSKTASRCIWVTRFERNTGGSMYNGMSYAYDTPGVDSHFFFVHTSGCALLTAGASQTATNSSDDGGSQVYTRGYHAYEVENLPSSVNGYINRVLNATKTTDLSRQHFQPSMIVYNGGAGHAKYCEAWNT